MKGGRGVVAAGLERMNTFLYDLSLAYPLKNGLQKTLSISDIKGWPERFPAKSRFNWDHICLTLDFSG
jgi:hypothetical protein